MAGAAGLYAGLARLAPAYAQNPHAGHALTTTNATPPPVSSGATAAVDLIIDRTEFRIGRRVGSAVTVNGSLPAPALRFREGQDIELRVTNRLHERTSIHWHGILLPNDQDGVPGVTFKGIDPGETFVYRFPLKQYGTYWYHSHSGMQEQLGLYGPFLIDPAKPEPFSYDRDYIVVLSDWTFADPMGLLAKLKKESNFSNMQRRTVGDFFGDVSEKGLKDTWKDWSAWSKMRMDPTDIADLTGTYFSFLLNGRPAAEPWTGLFRKGERIRLRFINTAATTHYDVRIPGMKMTVVEADGQHVRPVEVEEFRMGAAETYDVIVEPAEDRAYSIFAETTDRSGYALGMLAPREGMIGEIPPRRMRPLRTMADMGMGDMDMSAGSSHGGHSSSGGQSSPEGHVMGQQAMGNMPPPKSSEMMGMAKAGASAAGGMDHSAHGGASAGAATPAAGATGHAGHGAAAASSAPPASSGGHAGHAAAPTPAAAAGHSSHGATQPPGKQAGAARGGHAGMNMGDMKMDMPKNEFGPANSMMAMSPKSRAHEPGTGLGEDGRRVLVYRDLSALYPRPMPEPTREIVLNVTGNMERFVWGFDGKKFSESKPVRLQFGERVRVTFINHTMMEHPLHLHGMFMELENGGEGLPPLKHTVTVKPGEKISVLVTADARGDWAFHCHLQYHMEAGMFRVFSVV